MFDYLTLVSIQILTFPVRFLPYKAIHRFGMALGRILFYLLPKFRKRSLSNLALATDLHLSNAQMVELAKQSLGNLVITCLEYVKFSREKQIQRVARCENPEAAEQLLRSGKPPIFFCGHQSNWEVLFLEGTRRMPGVAIGRPIKNAVLYRWILAMREKYGGRMIARQNAVREALRGLKKGSFLGIVGDQGMPDSGFCSPFLGKPAWTSPLPAILSHRTGSPIIVATTKRVDGRYQIHYSDPIWPDQSAPLEFEVDRMMRQALALFQASIQASPGEWLWSHNRWKQQTPERIKRPFRHDSIAILLPQDPAQFEALKPHLATFRAIYPREFITLKAPRALATPDLLDGTEIETYESEDELFTTDFRFKLVFNFTGNVRLNRHYSKLAALKVIDLSGLRVCAQATPAEDLSTLLNKAVLHAS